MIKEEIERTIKCIGMDRFESPIFYNSTIGLRFEIGDPYTDIYLKDDINPIYTKKALKRVMDLYNGIPFKSNYLLWVIYPNNNEK